MSLASSIPSMKPKISFYSYSPNAHKSSLKTFVVIRGSQAEGPLRRPSAPSLSAPLSPPPAKPATVPPSPPPPNPALTAPATPVREQVVTLEYQRKVSKELQDYFRQKKLEDADQGPFFGFLSKNEIINGRWAMFGFAVGLLTEYATGSDLVQQLKILFSNFGIVDLD